MKRYLLMGENHLMHMRSEFSILFFQSDELTDMHKEKQRLMQFYNNVTFVIIDTFLLNMN